MKSTGYAFKGRWYTGSAEPPATVLEDESRFGRDGTFKADGEPDWVKNAAGLWVKSYDGINDYVSIPATVITGKDWAIMFWEFSPSTASNEAEGYFLCDSTDVNNLFFRRSGGGTDYSGKIGEVSFAGIGVPRGVPHFTVITHDIDGDMEFFVDAVSKDTRAGSNFVALQSPLYLGNRDAEDRPFEGYMTPPRIINYVPSVEQIAAIFQNERHWFGV